MKQVIVYKQKTTELDGEATFRLRSDYPPEIKAWRTTAGPQTNVPQKFVWHSPDGFEWGYGGSGPADFALNILVLFVDAPTARFLHQDFKFDFIAPMKQEGGTIKAETILDWIREQKNKP